jgi:hypothetical protein
MLCTTSPQNVPLRVLIGFLINDVPFMFLEHCAATKCRSICCDVPILFPQTFGELLKNRQKCVPGTKCVQANV